MKSNKEIEQKIRGAKNRRIQKMRREMILNYFESHQPMSKNELGKYFKICGTRAASIIKQAKNERLQTKIKGEAK